MLLDVTFMVIFWMCLCFDHYWRRSTDLLWVGVVLPSANHTSATLHTAVTKVYQISNWNSKCLCNLSFSFVNIYLCMYVLLWENWCLEMYRRYKLFINATGGTMVFGPHKCFYIRYLIASGASFNTWMSSYPTCISNSSHIWAEIFDRLRNNLKMLRLRFHMFISTVSCKMPVT